MTDLMPTTAQPSCQQRSPSRAVGRTAGFTMVEMLVVVGLIMLVVALSFPAIKSMRNRSAQVREMGAARNLFVAWTQYADANNSQILPGYRNGLPAFDEKGDPIATQTIGVAAARYPWRLAPYLSFNFRSLYLDENLRVLEDLESSDYADYLYQTSAYPSLGLNTTWVGGDESQGGFSAPFTNTFGKFYVTRLSEVRHPERLIVCASARGIDPTAGANAPLREGYFRVRSPHFTSPVWEASYDPTDAASYGHISSRNGDRTVLGFVAGHVESRSVDELRDMRLWADVADGPDWMLAPK